MTDPAIQDVIRQRIAIHGATAETRDKTMALIHAWGAEREAAGAVAALRSLGCEDASQCIDETGAFVGWRCSIHNALRKAEAHYQSCQDTLREIMG